MGEDTYEEYYEEGVPGEVGDEDEVVVDFSKVGVVPPKGTYVLEVMSAQKKFSGPDSKVPGTPMISLACRVVAPDEWTGVFVYDNLMLDGGGMGRTKAALEAMLGEAPPAFKVSSLVGLEFYALLVKDTSKDYGSRPRIGRYGEEE